MAVENSTDDEANATWIIDSGYLNHMIGNKKLFQTMAEASQQIVKLGDSKVLKVSGVSTVTFR